MGTEQKTHNGAIKSDKKVLKEAFKALFSKGLDKSVGFFKDAKDLYAKSQDSESVSISLSLNAFVDYVADKKNYEKSLHCLNDAGFLANRSNSLEAKSVSEIILAEIELMEEHTQVALLHYEKVQKYLYINDECELLNPIQARIRECYGDKFIPQKRDPLIALLKIGQAVSAETDINVLLKVIAEETKSAIEADRCSVFLLDKTKNELWSKVALGMDSQEIRFPADKGLAGHVVQTGETINIKDAYSDKRFNKEIDLQTGYKTKTILCMPIKNMKQEIIGAFQVLNKFEGVFNEEDEDLLIAIGSSAGIALENAQLFKRQQEMLFEQKQVFESFIDTLAASIDARDKITAGHSTRVRLYSGLIARELNLNERLIEIIEKAATLHDIGKIGIRDSVLQKEGKLTDEEYKHIQEHVEITHNILQKIHMSEDFKLVTEIACSHHEKYDGTGYYRKLKGESITLGGRILAVSDVFDAITSKRHYRDKMPIVNVIDILLSGENKHFDKKIVDCFLSISSDKIVNVFLTENNLTLDVKHIDLLKKYSLFDLYQFLQRDSETLNQEQKNFISTFQFYYTAKSVKEEVR